MSRMTVRFRVCSLIATMVATATIARAQPVESVWDAASGLTPDQVCPAWTLVDTAAASDPVLGGGVLVLSTASNAEDMFYRQAISLPAPDPIVIEARVQLSAGSSSSGARGPIAVGVTTSSNTGAFLFLGTDEMFLAAAGGVRGASATVDTDGALHTYRIEITAAGAVTVAYDGTPTLSGSTFTDASTFGPDPMILWGDGSSSASGTEAWSSFRHDAAVCESGTTTTITTTSSTSSSTIGATTTSTSPAPSTSTTSSSSVVPSTVSTSTATPPPTSSSTSTSGPPATHSTTSTTSKHASTTTSTLAGTVCDDVTPGSLDALRCRLGILRAQIETASGLGTFRPKLAQNAARAVALAAEAGSACDGGDQKTAKRRVKQIAQQLQKITHRLRGLAARKQLDAGLRADLITVVESIRDDATHLRKNPCS